MRVLLAGTFVGIIVAVMPSVGATAPSSPAAPMPHITAYGFKSYGGAAAWSLYHEH